MAMHIMSEAAVRHGTWPLPGHPSLAGSLTAMLDSPTSSRGMDSMWRTSANASLYLPPPPPITTPGLVSEWVAHPSIVTACLPLPYIPPKHAPLDGLERLRPSQQSLHLVGLWRKSKPDPYIHRHHHRSQFPKPPQSVAETTSRSLDCIRTLTSSTDVQSEMTPSKFDSCL